MLIKSKLSQTIFMGLFIGGLFFDIGTNDYTNINYWQSITGFLFFLTINAFFMALTPVSLTFPLDREIFFKEQDSKMYNVFQYFVATNIVEIPELAIIPFLFVIVYYFMIDLAMTGGQFFLHFFVIFLVGFTGSSLGLLFGSIIQDAKSVSTVIPIVVMPIILFSGFFKNRN
jgi:ABC-type multidrug transport system permease subunit